MAEANGNRSSFAGVAATIVATVIGSGVLWLISTNQDSGVAAVDLVRDRVQRNERDITILRDRIGVGSRWTAEQQREYSRRIDRELSLIERRLDRLEDAARSKARTVRETAPEASGQG